MAKPDKRTRERIGSSPSCFLVCFGFSRKKIPEKLTLSPEAKTKKKKKKIRWFSWSKLRPYTPIEKTEKPNSNAKKESDKHINVPVISRLTYRKNIPADDKPAKPDSEETNAKKERDRISDRTEPTNPLSSSKSDTFHERIYTSVCGKPDPTRPGKLGSNPEKSDRVGKFDPVTGLWIIMLTLAIMVIWGRMCAILCASAWCYFLPRVRDAAAAKRKRKRGSGAETQSGLDLNSEAYKTKVILQGFLGRQNRVSL